MQKETVKENHIISLKTPISAKRFAEAWKLLSTKEQNYAYNIHKGSFYGSLICTHQVSYESPVLFALMFFLFKDKSMKEVRERALNVGKVSLDVYEKFLAYFGGVCSHMGNFTNFGHLKFVPDLSEDEFVRIIKSSDRFDQFELIFGQSFESLWTLVSKEIFTFTNPFGIINEFSKGGISAYMSPSLSSEEIEMMGRFLNHEKINPLNTRLLKKTVNEESIYEVTIGSIEKGSTSYTFENKKFVVTKGEFSSYLTIYNSFLKEAQNHCRSELQNGLLDDYINHFIKGDMKLHHDSQKKWVKDISPPIESNIGWIETYLDPLNVRAYFETFTAIVNKVTSKKYENLVNISMDLMSNMPWDPQYNVENFRKPNFTSLEIISFASTGCCMGINIPNYDDIRQNIGFKNVYLANCTKGYIPNCKTFISKNNYENITKNCTKAYELHVALHELIGHGSGKLFMEDENGQFNFDKENIKSMLTGEKVTGWYKPEETWNKVFGAISTSYEECRADVAGLYLGFIPLAYELFGLTKETIKNNMGVMAFLHAKKAILGLKLFNPENNKWGQAHTQGAFVWVNYLYTHQDKNNKIISFNMNETKDDFVIDIDFNLFATKGRELTGEILRILQQYKSTANVKEASKFYAKYSHVDQMFLNIRDIVMKNLQPRKIDLNNELVKYAEDDIKPLEFNETFEGLVESMQYHFHHNAENLIRLIMNEWKVNAKWLRA